MKKLLIIPLLIAAIGCENTKNKPSDEEVQYHYWQNSKLQKIANEKTLKYQDSAIKYLGKPLFKKYIDSAEMYGEIGQFLNKNTPTQ